jgi:trans-aconitate methyltransferase
LGGQSGEKPMHAWESGQCLRFADERTRSALDLLRRLDLAALQRVIDRYAALLGEAFPARADGDVLLSCPRLIFIATPR